METETDNWTGLLDGLESQPLQGQPESFFAVAEEMRRFLRKRSHRPSDPHSPTLSSSLPSFSSWRPKEEAEEDDGYCPSDGIDYVAIRRCKRSRSRNRGRSTRLNKKPRPAKDLYAFKETDSSSFVSSSSSVASSDASSDSDSDDSGRSSPLRRLRPPSVFSTRPRTLALFRSSSSSSSSPSSSFCCSSPTSSPHSFESSGVELETYLPDIPSPTPPANDPQAPLAGSTHRCLRFRSSLQTMAGHPAACASEEWVGSELDLPADLQRSAGFAATRKVEPGLATVLSSARLLTKTAVEPVRKLALHRKMSVPPHYPPRPPLAIADLRSRHPSFAASRHQHASSASSAVSSHVDSPQGVTWLTDNDSNDQSPLLWKFLLELLENSRTNPTLVRWEDRQTLKFRLMDSQRVSQLWGERKKKRGMTYESLGRSLRYYYTKGVLEKVDGARLCYRFVEDHLRRKGIVLKRHDSSLR